MIPVSDQDSEIRFASRGGPRAVGPAQRAPGGFTLIELLVVLALVGLVAAIAFPNLEQMAASVTRATERDHILDQFAVLGRRALHRGRSYVVFGTGVTAEADSGVSTGVETSGEGVAATPLAAAFLRDGYEVYPIEVPEGWEIRLDPPLLVRANGVCLGAVLTLRYRGAEEEGIRLEAPWCRVDPDA